MSDIEAAQVVFGNVESAHSLERRGGFQCLFRSFSRLTEDEVREDIEPRLFFLQENPQDVKHCFFATSSGKVAIARCVPVAGTDQAFRTGLYVAHALVLSPDEFLRLNHNPFRVFDHMEFFKSVEEAQVAAGCAAGDIPLARVPLPAPHRDDTSHPISREQLLNLIILANRFAHSQNQGGSIGFYGQANKMLDILRPLFSLLPTRLRAKCTFDTFFVGGSPGRMPYWAVGFPENRSREPYFSTFELERESFAESIDAQPKTAFESWLTWMFAPPLSDLSKYVDEALYVSEVLDGRRVSGDVSPAITKLLIGFQPLLEYRLRERLRTQIGPALCERVLPQSLAWLGQQQGLAVLTTITEGASGQQLEQWLAEAYSGLDEKPLSSELRELETFSSRNQPSILSLIHLRWTGQWSVLRSVLRSADPALRRRFTKWALGPMRTLVRPTSQRGVLLSLGLFAEGDELQEAANLLSAILDKTPDEILSPSSGDAGRPREIPIEQVISLYAMIVENP